MTKVRAKGKKCDCRIPLYVTLHETVCLNCEGDITHINDRRREEREKDDLQRLQKVLVEK